MDGAVNLAEKLASFDDAFQPRIVGRFDGHKPMVAKTRGCPRADPEAHVLLVELDGTSNTGDADAEPAPEVEI